MKRISCILSILSLMFFCGNAFGAAQPNAERELTVSMPGEGGEYESISEALASLDEPNITPTVIKVMPGEYIEGLITMKDKVHLQGSGREVTTIKFNNNGEYIYMDSNVYDAAITGLRIEGKQFSVFCDGCGNLRVSNNEAVGTGSEGIAVYYGTGRYVIENNIVSGFSVGIDIYHSDTSDTIIRDNYLSGNQYGLYLHESNNIEVMGNTVSGHAYGCMCNSTNLVLMYNNIAGGTSYDIKATGYYIPHISFNKFDVILGTKGIDWVGNYNVKSDGT